MATIPTLLTFIHSQHYDQPYISDNASIGEKMTCNNTPHTVWVMAAAQWLLKEFDVNGKIYHSILAFYIEYSLL